jgi:competence protein ComFC
MMATSKLQLTGERIRRVFSLTWQGLNHLLWPAVCANCGDRIAEASDDLCTRCWGELLTCTAGDTCPRCGRDASRYGLVAGACAACQPEEIHFDGIARTGVYTDALRQMILAFKHDRTEFARMLAALADAALQGSRFCNDIELLVPVPLHWTRRLLRGYNQSHLVARRLEHPHARICTDLVRIRRTRPQPVADTLFARRRKVAGAFAVREDHRFAGKTICLIDDIKTTGATLNECARTLKEAGAARVYALVLAVAGQKTALQEPTVQAVDEPGTGGKHD